MCKLRLAPFPGFRLCYNRPLKALTFWRHEEDSSPQEHWHGQREQLYSDWSGRSVSLLKRWSICHSLSNCSHLIVVSIICTTICTILSAHGNVPSTGSSQALGRSPDFYFNYVPHLKLIFFWIFLVWLHNGECGAEIYMFLQEMCSKKSVCFEWSEINSCSCISTKNILDSLLQNIQAVSSPEKPNRDVHSVQKAQGFLCGCTSYVLPPLNMRLYVLW